MSITLTHPTAGPGGTPVAVALPPDLIWTDEFSWSPVEQSVERGITGALVIDAWVKTAGRPITLAGDIEYAWLVRSQLLGLHAWKSQPAQTFSLTRMGETKTVMFDQAAGGIEAAPVVPYSDPEPQDHYTLTLRFIQI